MDHTLKRPSSADTDEDLFDQQKAFLGKKNQRPSVKVIKLNQNNSQNVEAQPKEDDFVEVPFVVKNIMERDVTSMEISNPVSSWEPFPAAPRRITSANSAKSASLFWQSHQSKEALQQQTNTHGCFSADLSENSKLQSIQDFSQESKQLHYVPHDSMNVAGPSTSEVKDPLDDKKTINEENMNFMASFSTADILRKQKELTEMLGPNLVEFLKTRSQGSDESFRKISESNDIQVPESSPTIMMEEEQPGSKCFETLKSSSDINMEDNHPKSQKRDLAKVELVKSLAIPEGKWLDLAEFEQEKLQWVKDVHIMDQSESTEYGKSARFNFDGKLMKPDEEVDPRKGLHHHGEEPGRAGYTVDEIFMLVRSTNVGQRVCGLNLLGRILQNENYGMYIGCFEPPLLEHLLSSGVIPLIRFALDDNVETTICAAVYAMKCLLYSQYDELCLDAAFNWSEGEKFPQVNPHAALSEKDLKEMSDDQILKADVIQGLMRMDLLQRFTYILKNVHEDSTVITCIFQIVISLGRHSSRVCEHIVKHKEFMKSIFELLSPEKFGKCSINEDGAGYVLFHLLKLIRVLSCSGYEITFSMFQKHSSHLKYIMPFFAPSSVSEWDNCTSWNLQCNIEKLRLWKVLMHSQLFLDEFLDWFPVLVQNFQMISSLNLNSSTSKYLYDLASTFLSVFESWLSHLFEREPDFESNSSFELAVNGLFSCARTCFCKWLTQLANNADYVTNFNSSLTMISKCINVFTIYLNRSVNYTPPHSSNCYFDSSCQAVLFEFLKSRSFSNLQEKCWLSSSFAPSNYFQKQAGRPSNFPSLGRIFGRVETSASLKSESPFPILTSLCKILNSLSNVATDHDKNLIITCVFESQSLRKYLNDVSRSDLVSFQWAKRYELHFIIELLRLVEKFQYYCVDEVYYQAALAIIPHLQHGDETMALSLFSNIIFNSKMSLPSLKSSVEVLANSKGLNHNDLSCIGDVYRSIIAHPIETLILRNRKLGKIAVESHHPLIAADWMYEPLVKLQADVNFQANCPENEITVKTIEKALTWILYLEQHVPHVMSKMNFATHYCRLACLFLCENSLFIEPNLDNLLKSILKVSVNRRKPKELDFTVNIPGIPSFKEFYEELLLQFQAVSYGNQLFSSFLMIPLQQHSGRPDLRLLLWRHHRLALKFLTLNSYSLDIVFLPVQNYLYPFEINVDVLRSYFEALASGLFKLKSKSLFLYLLCVHHLQNFMKKPREQLSKAELNLHEVAAKLSNEDIMEPVRMHDGADIDNLADDFKHLKLESWNQVFL